MSDDEAVDTGVSEKIIEIRLEFAGTALIVRSNDPALAGVLGESYSVMLQTPGAGDDPPFDSMRDAGVLDLTAEHPVRTELIQFVFNEISQRFVRARSDLLWLHAGAVERDGRALILAGASGQGKSTLTTTLCEHGWHYMSDDVAPVDMATDAVFPFPQMPRRRVYTDRDLTGEWVQTLERKGVRIPPENVRREATPVGAIVFVNFRRGSDGEMTRLTEGALVLGIVGSSRNFPDHRNEAVSKASAIARRVPGYRLDYDNPGAAVRAIHNALGYGLPS